MLIGTTVSKFVTESFKKMPGDLIRGEGISKMMNKNRSFLSLIARMVAVGNGNGYLNSTLVKVTEICEMQAKDRTSAHVGLIQPIFTVFMGFSFVVL